MPITAKNSLISGLLIALLIIPIAVYFWPPKPIDHPIVDPYEGYTFLHQPVSDTSIVGKTFIKSPDEANGTPIDLSKVDNKSSYGFITTETAKAISGGIVSGLNSLVSTSLGIKGVTINSQDLYDVRYLICSKYTYFKDIQPGKNYIYAAAYIDSFAFHSSDAISSKVGEAIANKYGKLKDTISSHGDNHVVALGNHLIFAVKALKFEVVMDTTIVFHFPEGGASRVQQQDVDIETKRSLQLAFKPLRDTEAPEISHADQSREICFKAELSFDRQKGLQYFCPKENEVKLDEALPTFYTPNADYDPDAYNFFQFEDGKADYVEASPQLLCSVKSSIGKLSISRTSANTISNIVCDVNARITTYKFELFSMK